MRLCHVWENEPGADSLEPAGIHHAGKWGGQFGAEGFTGFGHGDADFGEDFYAGGCGFFSSSRWSAVGDEVAGGEGGGEERRQEG